MATRKSTRAPARESSLHTPSSGETRNATEQVDRDFAGGVRAVIDLVNRIREIDRTSENVSDSVGLTECEVIDFMREELGTEQSPHDRQAGLMTAIGVALMHAADSNEWSPWRLIEEAGIASAPADATPANTSEPKTSPVSIKIDDMDHYTGLHLRSIDSLVAGIKALLPEGEELICGDWRKAGTGHLDDPSTAARTKLMRAIGHTRQLVDEIKYHSDTLENELDCDFEELRTGMEEASHG